jgi:tetratricopeptide (TPR) repeat protein
MLEAEPASVEQLLQTGWSERRRGNHAAALEAFEAAAALDPNRSGIKVELAYELRLLDRLKGAEAVLTALLEAEPDNVGALIERAHLLRRDRDHSGAAALFQTAVSISPRNVPLRLELVRELQALDQWEEAEEELSKALQIDPGNVAASIERGHIRRRLGDHVGAALAFGAAVAADAGNLDIRLEFARELRAADRLEEAEAVLRALLEADPKRAGALVERAYLSRQRGDRARAVADFEAAANAIAPDDAQAVDIALQLAKELRDHRRFDDAFGVIQSVLEKHPDHLSARLQHGEILRELGDRAKALESFRLVVGRNPDHVPALIGLAREYEFAGSSKAAQAMLNRALLYAPNDFAALIAAAEQALASDDAETALRLSRDAIARHPDQLAPYLLGARAAAQFDRAAAEELLDRARAAFGPVGDVGAMQVHILRSHRDYDAARAVIAGSGELVNVHPGLWREATSLAIAMGDFESAESALAAPPETSMIGGASVHALCGQLAQTHRNYAQAAKHYRGALAHDNTSREWLVELAQCHLLLADFTRDPKPYQFTSLEEVIRIADFDEIRSKFPFIRKLKAPEETTLSDVERVLWARR